PAPSRNKRTSSDRVDARRRARTDSPGVAIRRETSSAADEGELDLDRHTVPDGREPDDARWVEAEVRHLRSQPTGHLEPTTRRPTPRFGPPTSRRAVRGGGSEQACRARAGVARCGP